MPILALQNSPSNGTTPLVLADGVVVVPVAFPAPTIEQRKCRTQSAGAAGEECFGNGLCDELGACICSGGFNPESQCFDRLPPDVQWLLSVTVVPLVSLMALLFLIQWQYFKRKQIRVSDATRPQGL